MNIYKIKSICYNKFNFKKFESNKIFLPQLIQSANVAQCCFDVIKEQLSKTDGAPESKGKIILATVKGDIHDIGKNIVKLLLENYGFEVFDLGSDVDSEAVVNEAVSRGASLVALSALMTTTAPEMQKVIECLRKASPSIRVMVGGAVLTEDYAQKIGADFYGKDAMAAVRFAEDVERELSGV